MTNDLVSIHETAHEINELELFMKYKSSYFHAFMDLSTYSVYMITTLYLLWFFKNSYMSIFTIPLMALMGVRTFIIFHDCGHNSYTPNKLLNYVISHLTGALVVTSPNWSIDHHTHHSTNGKIGNEHKFSFNETTFLLKSHYLSFTPTQQFMYQIYKHPCIYFTFGPMVYFVVFQRFYYIVKKYMYSHIFPHSLFKIIFNHVLNNVLTYLYISLIYEYQILPHYICSFFISKMIAFTFFHNQHTFNPSYVKNSEEWKQKDSGLEGSSFIQVPWFLKYFFMGIEYHHIHHMNSKLPGYNLQKYHEEVVSKSEMFDNVHIVSMTEFYNNLWLSLYDEEGEKYIRFNEIKFDKDKDELKDKDI
jgi:omega-6 fatty acid desaturase (delta-12 desaturase)